MKLEGACETLLKQTVDKPPSSRPSSSASASSEAEVPVGSPVAVHVAPAPKGKATAKAPAPAPKGFKVLEPEGDLGPDSRLRRGRDRAPLGQGLHIYEGLAPPEYSRLNYYRRQGDSVRKAKAYIRL